MIIASRYHDISCGHRVVGHETVCQGLHGHNYRITFHCAALELDTVGRVIDFGIIKKKLCYWLENNWDHRMLLWDQDPFRHALQGCLDVMHPGSANQALRDSICPVTFNPTAENMALHLLNTVGPLQLDGAGVKLYEVVVEETRKCSAIARLKG